MVKEFTDAKLFPQIASGERRTYKRQGKKSGPQYESDAHRLAQRAKQIQYGENTPGYAHFMKALELYPELFKGCIPVKPAVMQKCSKRSWDGQIRKWRRALHMYDFVDFDNDEQGSKFIKEALIEQNKNPIFRKSASKTLLDGREVPLTPNAKPNPEVVLPEGVNVEDIGRVRYSFDDLMGLADSKLVAPLISLPEPLQWLDKRVDLEDDVEEEEPELESPTTKRGSESTNGPVTPFSASPSRPPPSPQSSLGPVQLFMEPMTPMTPSSCSENGMTPERSLCMPRCGEHGGSAPLTEGSPYQEGMALAARPMFQTPVKQQLDLTPIFHFSCAPAPPQIYQPHPPPLEMAMAWPQMCM
jgi:hypothetical protein